MAESEVQCHRCGVLNSSLAETCGACGKGLHTTDATLQSGGDVAATMPSGARVIEVASTALSESDPSVGDTVDGTILGRPDHTLIAVTGGTLLLWNQRNTETARPASHTPKVSVLPGVGPGGVSMTLNLRF